MSHHFTKTSPTKKKIKRHLGSKHEGTGVEQGQHTVDVVGITNAEWSKKELIVGETIDANVETFGFKDGAEIIFEIYETDPNSPDKMRDSIPKKINGNKAKLTWKYPEKIVPKNNASSQYSVASVYFTVHVQAESQMSGEIPVYSTLNIKVEKEDGTPIPKVEVVLNQSDGKTSFHNTDSSGMVKVEKLPPRNHKIKFPGSSRIVPEGATIFDFDSAPLERSIVALGNKINVFKLIELYYYCSHKIDGKRRSAVNSNVFEVVPDTKGNDKYKDDVIIFSRTATSLQANGKKLKTKPDEFGMHAFLLECESDFGEAEPDICDIQFWKGLVKPKEYPILGLPTSFTVKCYRSDLFKLQLKFPEMGKWSGGFKQQASLSEVINDVKNKKPKKLERTQLPKGPGWDLKSWPERVHSEKSVIFQRNDYIVDAKFMEYLGAFVELANKLSEIVSFVQDNVPQIGFYFTWECQVLQGTFVVDWGWKEYKDNRAYYYIGVNFDVKLVEVKLEIGVGVSGFAYKIQIYGALNGSVTLSAKLCRCSPDGEGELSIPFAGEIIGSLGARVEAGCFVKMEGTVETGIKMEDGALKFSHEDGLSAGCVINWAGLIVKLKISAGTAKKAGVDEVNPAEAAKEKREDVRPYETDEKQSSAYEHVLIKPQDLKRWEWSKDHKPSYNPPIVPAEELHNMLLKRLKEDSIKVLIRASPGFFDRDQYMEREDVAKGIEKVIHARNDIRKDPKTMEALSFDVKAYLLTKAQKSIVQQIDYFKFLMGKDFPKMLDKYKDPMQEILNENP
jgi:hypothetical protein